MMLVFVERNDLHRNVAGQRILFELTQHAPAEHIGKEDIERNGVRLILFGKLKRIGAALSYQHFETFRAGEIDQKPRVVWVVLHDQQDGIAGLNFVAVIRDLLGDALLWQHDYRRWRRVGSGGRARRDRWPGVSYWQV